MALTGMAPGRGIFGARHLSLECFWGYSYPTPDLEEARMGKSPGDAIKALKQASWNTGGKRNYRQESHFPEPRLCTFALKIKNKKREVTPQDPSFSQQVSKFPIKSPTQPISV